MVLFRHVKTKETGCLSASKTGILLIDEYVSKIFLAWVKISSSDADTICLGDLLYTCSMLPDATLCRFKSPFVNTPWKIATLIHNHQAGFPFCLQCVFCLRNIRFGQNQIRLFQCPSETTHVNITSFQFKIRSRRLLSASLVQCYHYSRYILHTGSKANFF